MSDGSLKWPCRSCPHPMTASKTAGRCYECRLPLCKKCSVKVKREVMAEAGRQGAGYEQERTIRLCPECAR